MPWSEYGSDASGTATCVAATSAVRFRAPRFGPTSIRTRAALVSEVAARIARHVERPVAMSPALLLVSRFLRRREASAGSDADPRAPASLTGAASAGCTVIAASCIPRTVLRSTKADGGGVRWPSVFTSDDDRSRSSVAACPASVPSSRTPMKTKPGMPCPEGSLANAPTACRTLSGGSPRSDVSCSTLSESGDTGRSSRSVSDRRVAPPHSS